ncbi:hypothetical protein [Pedobacter sp. MW01-1-1]|uniref:hypothetical protein n=1 Tax=Pedobacter sp. MW01-1-1 TaxID=3383027 RepID=UPI003FEF81EE
MKKTIRLVLAIAFICFIVSSCKKDYSYNQNESIVRDERNLMKDVTVKEGLLSFKNHESFSKIWKSLNNIPLEKVDSLLSKLNYISLEKDTLDENIRCNLKDPVIRRFLNKNGALHIEDKIYLYSENKEYTIKNSDFEVYKKGVQSKNLSQELDTNKVLVKTIVTGNLSVKSDGRDLNIMSSSAKITKPTTLAILTGGTQVNYSNEYNNGRPERVLIYAWAENTSLGSSCGVSLKGEAYRKGGLFGKKDWRSDEMYYARIRGNYTITHYGIFSESFDTGETYGIAECRNTFSSGQSGLTPVINRMSATYEWQKAPQNPRESFYKNF